jgi:2,4-dienoyl-CoA reductase-like NADH-dependent reductase (Old Yellow Enzyme family)/ribulose 1,5-bisphosphate synthetase/thiazole synthase
MALTHIHTPITIRGLEIPNRVVRTAHATGMATYGIDDTLINYHLERARGGVGLSIVELLPIHPSSSSFMPHYRAPGMQEGLKRLVDAVRPHNMRLFQQLWHGGHQAPNGMGGPSWSASNVPGPHGIRPIPMTQTMIDELLEHFARAARMCESVGFDGVDVHCAHGYLIHQFLSPATNRREDNYGGSPENRARFMIEVLRAIRSEVSEDFVIGVRMCADTVVGGLTSDLAAVTARLVDEQSLIDYLNISMGSGFVGYNLVGGMEKSMGYQLPTSIPIANAVSVPTIVIGRFRTMEEGDQIIRSGQADMVGMVRGTLADPDLVKKTLAGQVERVRPCIGCNQGCLGGLFSPKGKMGCVVNPAAGEESKLSESLFTKVKNTKKVLVVGAGPSGMEAARVAALRGHQVVIHEAQPHTGGAMRLAALAPKRHGVIDFVVWLENELRHLGVEIHLNSYIEADDVEVINPDVVVVATGSYPMLDDYPSANPGERITGIDQPHVVTSHDIFIQPDRQWGKHAVVIDDDGHYEAVAVTDHLLEQGMAVSLVTRHISFAPRLESTFTNEPSLQRLHSERDFTLHTRSRAVCIDSDKVLIAPAYMPAEGVTPENNSASKILPANTVVVISVKYSNRELYDELQARGIDCRVIGEAWSENYFGAAVKTGRKTGLEL